MATSLKRNTHRTRTPGFIKHARKHACTHARTHARTRACAHARTHAPREKTNTKHLVHCTFLEWHGFKMENPFIPTIYRDIHIRTLSCGFSNVPIFSERPSCLQVKLLRTQKREGLIRVRLIGARLAKGKVLMFQVCTKLKPRPPP